MFRMQKGVGSVMLNDKQILERLDCSRPMIKPWIGDQVREEMDETLGYYRVVSYGLSSRGYDIRLGSRFKYLPAFPDVLLDPKHPPKLLEFTSTDPVVIPAHNFVLAESYEEFDIPRDIMAICMGKSTYARNGVLVNVTPLEPEWRGVLTIEISNTSPVPTKIYPNEGIAQLMFFHNKNGCGVSYADRKGKYQDQDGVTGARV